jgi:SAM-dependent methyltransferase
MESYKLNYESPYKIHKKPLTSVPSKFLVKQLSLNLPNIGLPILDVGCGYGRNSLYLAELGYQVLAADYYEKVFADKWYEKKSNIKPITIDATQHFPFQNGTFGAVVVIHFYSEGLFQRLSDLVAPNGYIFYESIGGNGQNWIQLDFIGQVKKSLSENFTFRTYQEKAIGPNKSYASVKMVAQKNS